jgi:cytochrome P450
MIALLEPEASTAPALYPPSVQPAPRPLPVHRFLIQFLRNPLRSLPADAYEEPMVVLERGRRAVAWVTDPALTEEVLLNRAGVFEKTDVEKRVFARSLGDGILTSEGQMWRWQRQAMAPIFRPAELGSLVPVMARAAESLVYRWASAGARGWQSIETDMADVTFEIIMRTMLAGSHPAEAAAIRKATEDYLAPVSWEIAFGLMGLPAWLPHPGTVRMSRASRELRQAVLAIIRRQGAEPASPETDTLLRRLIAARDPETGTPMTEEQLVNNILTLLEAGHETTAKALTWTLYLLARSRHWQEAVRREVLAVAGTRALAADDLPALVQTQNVLKEALRLYPPAPVMARTLKAPLRLGGYDLPAASLVVIPVWCIHRHRRLWDDPDRFDPERFANGRDVVFPRTKYMPFGAGARICLGAGFAMREATVLLATFVRGARFRWDGRLEPEPVSRVTLRPKGGIRLLVEPIDYDG